MSRDASDTGAQDRVAGPPGGVGPRAEILRDPREDRRRSVAAMLAIVWAVAFAVIHVAWALGSTAGLDGRRVTGTLLIIDIVAIPLCLLAAWVAWRLSTDARARRAPALIHRLAVAAAVILGLRGLGTVQALVAPPDDATLLTRLVDPYFLVGGVLFAVVARRARMVRRSRGSAAS